MSGLEAKIRQALSETVLGSCLLIDDSMLDKAAGELVQFIRDERASSLMSVAWQVPPNIGESQYRQETKNHLLSVSEEVKKGTWWVE